MILIIIHDVHVILQNKLDYILLKSGIFSLCFVLKHLFTNHLLIVCGRNVICLDIVLSLQILQEIMNN